MGLEVQTIISLIQDTIAADAATGRLADVNSYCQRFERMRPDLDPKDIRDVVLDAVVSFGGAHAWSAGELTKH